MKYMLLIYDSKDMGSMSPEEIQTSIQEYGEFGAGLAQAGIEFSGEALHPVAVATTVRVRDGQTLTTDGPFAETKEQLGGFYIVDVDNLDEAIAVAAKIPDARGGSIEVRPIVDFSQ